MDGNIPYNYKVFIDERIISSSYNNEEYDLLIVLDTSDRKRLGKFENVLNNSKKMCIRDRFNGSLYNGRNQKIKKR